MTISFSFSWNFNNFHVLKTLTATLFFRLVVIPSVMDSKHQRLIESDRKLHYTNLRSLSFHLAETSYIKHAYSICPKNWRHAFYAFLFHFIHPMYFFLYSTLCVLKLPGELTSLLGTCAAPLPSMACFTAEKTFSFFFCFLLNFLVLSL